MKKKVYRKGGPHASQGKFIKQTFLSVIIDATFILQECLPIHITVCIVFCINESDRGEGKVQVFRP